MQIRRTKIKLEKQDIVKRNTSLAGQASPARGKATLRRKQPRRPRRACRGSRRQNHLTNHSNTTHVVNQCGVTPHGD